MTKHRTFYIFTIDKPKEYTLVLADIPQSGVVTEPIGLAKIPADQLVVMKHGSWNVVRVDTMA